MKSIILISLKMFLGFGRSDMEKLRFEMRVYSYPIREGLSYQQLKQYVENLKLEDLPLESLQRLANRNGATYKIVNTSTRDELLDWLRDRKIEPPLANYELQEIYRTGSCGNQPVETQIKFNHYYGGGDDQLCIYGAAVKSLLVKRLDATVRTKGRSRTVTLPIKCSNASYEELKELMSTLNLEISSNQDACTMINRFASPGSLVTFEHGPPVPFPTFKDPLIKRLPCANRDVPDFTIQYDEYDTTYCFNDNDLPLLRKYGLNPYSGHSLTPDALKDLNVKVNSFRKCYNGRLPLFLSTEVSIWLGRWMGLPGLKISEYTYRIPPSIQIGLSDYRPCTEIVVYRGFHFTNENYLRYTTEHPSYQEQFEPLSLNSWTTDLEVARRYLNFGNRRSAGFIYKTILTTDDILVDTTLLPSSFLFAYPVYLQSEVIALPGLYNIEIVEEQN